MGASKAYRRLTEAEREEARTYLAAGMTQPKAAAKFGVSRTAIARLGPVSRLREAPSPQAQALRRTLREQQSRQTRARGLHGMKLTEAEREEIRTQLAAGMKLREAAAAWGVSLKTVGELGSVIWMREFPSAQSQQLRKRWHEDRLRRGRETRGRKERTSLTTAELEEVRARLRDGMRLADAATEYGVSLGMLRKLGSVRLMRLPTKARSPLRLSGQEREEISIGVRSDESARSIAARLRRAPSTVSREIARSGGRATYRAWDAESLTHKRARRPKERKLAAHAPLRGEVERRLANFWSPEQIAGHLAEAHPDDPSMRVSHETIYKTLFVQGRGALRKELTKFLRTQRKQRRPSKAGTSRGRIKDMVMISERPPEVEDRAVPGHWEGDLIIGKDGKSAIGTLVERRSRYVILLRLPNGRTAEDVRSALSKLIKRLPLELIKSLTWDQGKEMAEHVRFTVESGVQVYFCDPHSPWQRGSNENTNGLLRQYFPKGTDLSRHSQADLNRAARSLNGRPRQTLGWMTPSQKLKASVAMTP
jgi:transposase, IS30 family